MTEEAKARLDTWLDLPRAKLLTDQVAQTITAWTMLGYSLTRVCDAGGSEEQRLNAAKADELPTVSDQTGIQFRPPSRYKVLQWLAKGGEDAKNGKTSDESQFGVAYAYAREAASDADYDELVEIERRMLAPAVLPNPDYVEGDKKSPKKINNPYYIDAGTGNTVIRSIQWRLSRQRPEKYGDRIDVNANIKETRTFILDAPPWLQQVIGDRAGSAVDASKADVPPVLEGQVEARTPTTSGAEPDA